MILIFDLELKLMRACRFMLGHCSVIRMCCTCLWFYQLQIRGIWSNSRKMDSSDTLSTIRLLQCLAGSHNISGFDAVDDKLASFSNVSSVYRNESYGIEHHRMLLQSASNRSGADSWNADNDETTWLREGIKSKLVPTICVVGIVGNLLALDLPGTACRCNKHDD